VYLINSYTCIWWWWQQQQYIHTCNNNNNNTKTGRAQNAIICNWINWVIKSYVLALRVKCHYVPIIGLHRTIKTPSTFNSRHWRLTSGVLLGVHPSGAAAAAAYTVCRYLARSSTRPVTGLSAEATTHRFTRQQVSVLDRRRATEWMLMASVIRIQPSRWILLQQRRRSWADLTSSRELVQQRFRAARRRPGLCLDVAPEFIC